jgi:hypothetical protein
MNRGQETSDRIIGGGRVEARVELANREKLRAGSGSGGEKRLKERAWP